MTLIDDDADPRSKQNACQQELAYAIDSIEPGWNILDIHV